MDAKGIKQLIDKLNTHTATALEAAAGFATSRGHYEVLPEHLLIKLMEEGSRGDLDCIFEFFNLDQDAIWHDTLTFLSEQNSVNQSKPVFSRRLYEWLERAWLSANVKHQSDWITGAALVDAFIELVPLSPATQLAAHFSKLDGHFLAEKVDKICQDSSERKQAKPNAERAMPTHDTQQTGQALNDYCDDLTAKAQRGDIDPVLGRNDEIRMAIDVLCRRRKNNPILVGEPGVGKTAVVEGLAQRIVEGQVPHELKQVRIMVLDMGLLQAGAGVKGEFERRLKQVIDEVKSSPEPIIMFIDEAHTLIGAGGEAGMSDAANLLKPALARGELRTVAATTWSEYKKYFERDAALERRFQLIKVEEPSLQAAKLMLSGLKKRYQSHHQITITDQAIEAAVSLSSRYISGRYLPDKAIDVLDTAAARVRMSVATEPSSIEAEREHIRYLEQRIRTLENEQALGVSEQETTIAQLHTELANAQQHLDTLQSARNEQIAVLQQINALDDTAPLDEVKALRDILKQHNSDGNSVHVEVDADAVAQIIAEWTGVPAGSMVKDQLDTLIKLESTMARQVVGQDGALLNIAERLRVAKSGIGNEDAPLGVFLLAGPSGVGKTETARALAEHLFGGDKFLVTINMSEYQEAHTVSQLKGSPPGYVGYGEGGILTEAVRQRPYSVVLLDEVEKAHIDVMSLFYQVFERGVMRDGEGREIDFRNTVILMTSNLAAEQIIELCTPPESPLIDDNELTSEFDNASEVASVDGDKMPDEQTDPAWQRPTLTALSQSIKPFLLNHFAPALLARMEIVPYYPLDSDALKQIVMLKLEAIATRLQAQHQMAMRVDGAVVAQLSEQCQLSDSGARRVNAVIEQQILPGIAKSLLGFMAEEDMPDVMTLTLDDEQRIDVIFADNTAS